MKQLQRLHPDLSAFTLRFEPALLDEIRASFQTDLKPFLERPASRELFSHGGELKLPVGPEPSDYYIFNYHGKPLLWFSAHSAKTFELFQRFFDRLDLDADLRCLIDIQTRPVMYSAFFVICQGLTDLTWHQDYAPGSHAFTLITPLDQIEADQGQLLFQELDQHVCVYPYQTGEAILFGPGFLHSTEPFGPSQRLRVLVSLTCGSDKFQYWDQTRKTIQGQAMYYKLPCGHLNQTCSCLQNYRIAQEYSRHFLGGR